MHEQNKKQSKNLWQRMKSVKWKLENSRKMYTQQPTAHATKQRSERN